MLVSQKAKTLNVSRMFAEHENGYIGYYVKLEYGSKIIRKVEGTFPGPANCVYDVFPLMVSSRFFC